MTKYTCQQLTDRQPKNKILLKRLLSLTRNRPKTAYRRDAIPITLYLHLSFISPSLSLNPASLWPDKMHHLQQVLERTIFTWFSKDHVDGLSEMDL